MQTATEIQQAIASLAARIGALDPAAPEPKVLYTVDASGYGRLVIDGGHDNSRYVDALIRRFDVADAVRRAEMAVRAVEKRAAEAQGLEVYGYELGKSSLRPAGLGAVLSDALAKAGA